MLTLLEIVKRTTDFFEKRGVENPRLNAELLIGHALGLKRMQLYLQFERPLTEPELVRIRPLVKRRGDREPLQYVMGSTEFSGLQLKVDRRALIPRPETELLVEMLKDKYAAKAPARVIDLGTGTGAIACALAKLWAEAAVIAVERSPEALALAAENVAALELAGRVKLLLSDWFSAVPQGDVFDLIVSNPPYLSDAETQETTPEVKGHEPRAALSSGPAGSEALETIIRASRERLAPGGVLALETGIAQHAALGDLARSCGFQCVESRKDLTGRDRYLFVQ